MHITVIRDGQISAVNSTALVVGDVVQLNAGDLVPADMRVVKSASLRIDMFSVTGTYEVAPRSNRCTDDNPLNSENMLFCGSLVSEGSATAVVLAIGAHTFVAERDRAKPAPPRAVRNPPCMPSKYVSRLVKLNVHVRKPEALATMRDLTHLVFNLSYFCERSRMEVAHIFCNDQVLDVQAVKLPQHVRAVHAIAVCAVIDSGAVMSGQTALGQPVEAALVQFFHPLADVEGTRKAYPVQALRPFQPSLKFTASLHGTTPDGGSDGDAFVVAMKGAPEVVLSRCATMMVDDHEVHLDATRRAAIDKVVAQMCAAGNLVMAFAWSKIPLLQQRTAPGDDFPIDKLVFLGLVSMGLRLRAGIDSAVRKCVEHGVTPVLFSGAHPVLVKAIAKQTGIITDDSLGLCITGSSYITDFSPVMSPRRQVVFGRVKPADKLRLVEALQASGCTVAVTGDHPNDVAAMQQADMAFVQGISGTDVCREESSAIVLDDSFNSLVESIVAVKEWRPGQTCCSLQ
eukprot:TRINITY_DN1638_c0_g1_i1.p1 TRINITY_DN1638_c0_g1~~TRINITY_DN1638_c0_g1_i1.p1  ORF type:complete len:513 (+),score=80.96 TRINITY_DN1638_c0_g1_i1:300-1838(+)